MRLKTLAIIAVLTILLLCFVVLCAVAHAAIQLWIMENVLGVRCA